MKFSNLERNVKGNEAFKRLLDCFASQKRKKEVKISGMKKDGAS